MVSFFEQTIATATGDYDLFEFDPAADEPIELVGLFLGNKSEVGDAQEEMVSWSVWRAIGGTFTSANGTGATEDPTDDQDEVGSFASETVGGTVATTTGTLTHLHQDTFNIRTGLQVIWPPDMRIKASGNANTAMGVRLRTALADDATMSGTAYVRQL
jgi:hypothetical protein